MAAARLGYLIAPAWVVERLNAAVLPYHLDAVSQIAGAVALEFEAEMHARVARLVEQRGVIQGGLSELGVEFWPSQSNFILFRPPGGAGGAKCGKSSLMRESWCGTAPPGPASRDV